MPIQNIRVCPQRMLPTFDSGLTPYSTQHEQFDLFETSTPTFLPNLV